MNETNSHKPLMAILLDKIWVDLRTIEPVKIPGDDIRLAIHTLQKLTHLTYDELATRIGRPVSYLYVVETRNSYLHPEVCASLCEIAQQYDLPILAEWFDLRMLYESHRKKAQKRWGI